MSRGQGCLLGQMVVGLNRIGINSLTSVSNVSLSISMLLKSMGASVERTVIIMCHRGAAMKAKKGSKKPTVKLEIPKASERDDVCFLFAIYVYRCLLLRPSHKIIAH